MVALAQPTEEVSISAIMERSRIGWQFRWLYIRTKSGEVVRYGPNLAQGVLHTAMEAQRNLGLPVRIIVLKARQRGISTGVEARFFERIYRRPNANAVVVSMDAVSTRKVFSMVDRFQAELHRDVRRTPMRSNRIELAFPRPHNSAILCQTAGTGTLGRGGTTQYVHATEVAFWHNAEEQLLGLLQEVPKLPETEVVIESTANGVGGAFHDRYWDAKERLKDNPDDLSGYMPLFLPWYTCEEYRSVLPKSACDENGRLRLINDEPYFENDTVEHMASLGVTLDDDQVYWRRVTIRDECGADLRLFHQEYPATEREAFVATGYNIFSSTVLDKHEAHCRPPIATVEFCRREGKISPVSVLRGLDCWRVWTWPERKHEYVLFGDVCEGLLANPNQSGGDTDYHYAGIMSRMSGQIVATFRGRCDTSVYGYQMALAGRFYRNAMATPEINSCGLAVLNELRRDEYPNIYIRQVAEDEEASDATSKLGFRTTTLNRKPGLSNLRRHLHDMLITIYDRELIAELRVFINDNGKWQAQTGCHDDGVMMLSGLLQIHEVAGPLYSDVLQSDTSERPGENGEFSMVSVVGGYDDTADDDDDEEGFGL